MPTFVLMTKLAPESVHDAAGRRACLESPGPVSLHKLPGNAGDAHRSVPGAGHRQELA